LLQFERALGRELAAVSGPEDTMPASRKVDLGEPKRLLDDFFKVDEVAVAHERADGTMSPKERRLIFERGDAVAIILYDAEAKSVILVDQFKVPSLIGRRRDDPGTMDGWITEATAGMIDPGETAEQAIIRETAEETGYRISNPKLIAKFFSSPGGTSERIFLYFAEVRAADKVGEGGGLPGEDITVLTVPLADLFDRLAKGLIDDPKLAIGVYWLKDYLKSASDHLVESLQITIDDLFQRSLNGSIKEPKLLAAAAWLQDHLRAGEQGKTAGRADAWKTAGAAPGPLPYSTVRYRLKDRPDLVIGYKTGPIDGIRNVDIWVNSENTNMLMDRFIGRSISARIRYLGSNRDEQGNVIEDTICEALRTAVGPRGHVPIGAVLVTESGLLRKAPHRVKRIFHVATVEADPGAAIRGRRDMLKLCAQKVLEWAEQENRRLGNVVLNLCRFCFKLKEKNCESILIPMMGAGEGGLQVEEVAQIIVPAAVDHLRNVYLPTLKEVYFLAFTARDRSACAVVLEQYCAQGVLSAVG
jgi:nudix-type nucleoside diphosphatase (YffH/AdpP family)